MRSKSLYVRLDRLRNRDVGVGARVSRVGDDAGGCGIARRAGVILAFERACRQKQAKTYGSEQRNDRRELRETHGPALELDAFFFRCRLDLCKNMWGSSSLRNAKGR